MPKADPRALELAQRLRQAAKHRGLKQADVVRALGALPGTISRYFSGTRRMSDLDRLDEIAALLGVSYEWLSLGRGEPSYDPGWRRPPDGESGDRPAGGDAPIRRHHPAGGGGTGGCDRSAERDVARSTSAPPAADARQAPGGGEAAVDDPYLERQRALVALRPHLQGDQNRVRDTLLLLKGPPYDAWTRDDWEAEAWRERDRLAALDARWRRPVLVKAGPARTPKPTKTERREAKKR